MAAIAFAVLPMQTESVAWVTGRVDSMPACLYLAAFLAFVRWRQGGRVQDYWWSVVWCFAALFSKQNTVTLAAALVLFDAVLGGRPVSGASALSTSRDGEWRRIASWAAVRPYAPFVALTLGYLWLRYLLFGEVARESMLTAAHLRVFAADAVVHLKRLAFGEVGVTLDGLRMAVVIAGTAAAATAFGLWQGGRQAGALIRAGFYFGLIWIVLCVAPTVVVGYASPRHMYLASVGWVVTLGVVLELFWRGQGIVVRALAVSPAAWLLVAYTSQLQRDVALWGTRSRVSRQVVYDLAAEARRLPVGSLVLVGAPRRSFDFAVPHALRPPFTGEDVAARLRIVSHSSLHCCPANIWEPHTRGAMRAWLADTTQPRVVALYWHPDTGDLSRVDDVGEPFLRTLVPILLDTCDVASLDSGLLDVFNKLVAGRRVAPN